jgi:NADPH-dependent 7-cyano-7-deazaguanine reductase QueF
LENAHYECGLELDVVFEGYVCGTCPETGQPDVGTLRVAYTPNTHIAECYSLRRFVIAQGQGVTYQENFVHDLYLALDEALLPQQLTVSFTSARRWDTERECNPVTYSITRRKR